MVKLLNLIIKQPSVIFKFSNYMLILNNILAVKLENY